MTSSTHTLITYTNDDSTGSPQTHEQMTPAPTKHTMKTLTRARGLDKRRPATLTPPTRTKPSAGHKETFDGDSLDLGPLQQRKTADSATNYNR